MNKHSALLVYSMTLLFVSLWAQSTPPMHVWSKVSDWIPLEYVEDSKNILVIGDHICFTVAGSNYGLRLVQIDKNTRELEWLISLNAFTQRTGQLARTPDNNIAVIDSSRVLRKISVQDGAILWSRYIEGYAWPGQDYWTISSNPGGILCRGNKYALLLVDNDGNITGVHENVYPGEQGHVYSTPIHGIYSDNEDEAYLFQDSIVCDHNLEAWRAATSIAKLNSIDYSKYFIEEWTTGFLNDYYPQITAGNNLYMSSHYYDMITGLMYAQLRRLDAFTGDQIWLRPNTVADDIFYIGVVPNGTGVIVYGLRTNSLVPVLICYSEAGIVEWVYDVPFPQQGEYYGGILSQFIRVGNSLYGTGVFGTEGYRNTWNVCLSVPVSSDEQVQAPGLLTLNCFPNPFINSLSIKIDSKAPDPVSVEIYNIRGQLLKTMDNLPVHANNSFELDWDGTSDSGSSLGSGVYLVKVSTQTSSQTKRVVLAR